MKDVETVCTVVRFDGAHCHEAELWLDVHVRAVHAVFGFYSYREVPAILAP